MNELFKMIMLPTVASMLNSKNMETLDLTSKEGHDKAVEIIKEAANNEFTKSFFGNEFLNNITKKVDAIYEEANPKQQYVGGGIMEVKNENPVQPSTHCTNKQKAQITKLVDEYVDTVIQPIGNFDAKIIKSVKNSLFEFACWILNR